MTIATQTAALTLGTLDLMGAVNATYGYRIFALGDNFETGDPEAVIAQIQSQLQDGDLERIDRYGNRSATIPLMIDAPSSATPGEALAQGAAAIDMACTFDGWTTLTYTPALLGAQACVFEVTTATVSAAFDDVAETVAGQRFVTLTLHCRPFVRAATLTTIDAPATTGTTTTNVDSGSSTTGWSVINTPANVHNLCPNPSFETNTTGWTAAFGTSSIAQDSSFAYVGSKSMAVTTAAGATVSYVGGPVSAVTAGQSYAISCAIYPRTVTGQTSSATLMIRWYSDAGGTTQIGSDVNVGASPVSDFIWAGLAGQATAPTGAVSMRMFPSLTAPSGYVFTGNLWNLDACAVVDVTGVLTYFDGATASTSARTHSWTGTANNSTSTLTWTTPTVSVVSGMVQGKVYGVRGTGFNGTIRRTGAISMTTLKYARIKGVAITSAGVSATLVSIADNGGSAISPMSYNLNLSTGAFDITIYRPTGFTTVDVTGYFPSIQPDDAALPSVDSIDITDNPFGNGKVVTRQVAISGSRRTELSLSVLGLDGAGTTAVALGEQVLVHTAAKGSDGTAKFLALRAASGVGGTADATATSGVYTTLGTTATSFTFPASSVLTGNYMVYSRLRSGTVGLNTISFRAYTHPSTGDNMYDPASGYKTAPITFAASGSWPTLITGSPGTWGIVPLGMVRLPPADVAGDSAATIGFEIFRSALGAVDLDDVFFCNADVGQTSLMLTTTAGGSYSAARLDAATITAPQPRAWVGVANATATGTMIADGTRWRGEQHLAPPGLLQISTVTPNCATSRISGSYYRRNQTYMAST